MIDYTEELAVFIKGLEFLESLGFEGPNVKIKFVDLVGDKLYLTYKSPNAKRSVDITYAAAQLNHANVIGVIVTKNDGSYFSVGSWLTANDLNDAITFFALDDPDYNKGQFIEKFCRDFTMICQNRLRKILTGDEWQDVPFDWKGYR